MCSLNKLKHILREIFLINNRHTIRYGIVKGLKRVGGITFLPYKKPISKEHLFLQKLSLTNKTVFDIGAYEGLLTIFFAKKVGPNGFVVAFEPNPVNYNRVKKNLEINNFNNVLLEKVAIANQEKIMKLSHSKYFKGHSSLMCFENDNNQRSYSVIVTYIDKLIAETKIPIPNFIKIDIEGFELQALFGMKNLIMYHKPQLFIEVHGFVKNNMQNIIKFLDKYEYKIHHVERDLDSKDIQLLNISNGHIFCS